MNHETLPLPSAYKVLDRTQKVMEGEMVYLIAGLLGSLSNFRKRKEVITYLFPMAKLSPSI
jgi:hypothetical protein